MNKTQLAKKFDKQVNKQINQREKRVAAAFRRKLFSETQGHTLEVAVGAGMNFPYYSKSIHLTAVDISPKMIEAAKVAAEQYGINGDFYVADVETLDFDHHSFDTIVSSATMCTYEDPVKVLDRFNQWCKPGEKILLMEHGLSTSATLAWLQQRLDRLAVRAIGCHQNRDIHAIVERLGLKILKEERHVLGYLYLIWASPTA